ncbi:MAG: ABC transporter ATP-binding protein [Planctomycetota bacterium]
MPENDDKQQTASTPPAIEVRGLMKRFGPPGVGLVAVDGIDLDVRHGEVLGFLGPNGAGKSTTMKMVTGFLEPTAGSVRVSGVDVAKDPLGVKARIGYLPEGAPAYPDMTPIAFLKFCCEVRGISGKERKSAVERASSLTHLEGVMQQPIETLSKGYKRRVGLAQSILHEPKVLILDEPTDGLDPNQKHEVRELITRMASDTCIVLSTHILEEVEAVCTRAVIIARGEVVADDTPVGLKARSSAGKLDEVFREITTGSKLNGEAVSA